MDAFYARKLEFGMPLTQIYTFKSTLKMPLGHALGLSCGSNCITHQIEHLFFMHPDIAIWAKTKGRGHLCTLDTCLVFARDTTFVISHLSSSTLIPV